MRITKETTLTMVAIMFTDGDDIYTRQHAIYIDDVNTGAELLVAGRKGHDPTVIYMADGRVFNSARDALRACGHRAD